MQMKKCMDLDEKLKAMEREISVNPQFVQKVLYCPFFLLKLFRIVLGIFIQVELAINSHYANRLTLYYIIHVITAGGLV